MVIDVMSLTIFSARENSLHVKIKFQVRKHDGLSKESPDIVPVITGVLATSQAYMRDRKVP